MTVEHWFDESMLPDFDGIFVNDDGRLEDEYGALVYLVDGACRFNGRRDAYGAAAFFAGPECWNQWSDPENPSTNNSSELQSVFGAVNMAGKNDETNIRILCDSEYAINCVNYWPNQCWRPNARPDGTWENSKGNPVSNQYLIKAILKSMKMNRVVADLQWISRCDNYIADRMAKEVLDWN